LGAVSKDADRRVTLRDIAAKARVSRMAVSLALRNHPSLPAKTRERIQKIAQKLDFQPDPDLARLLAQIRARKQRGITAALGFLVDCEKLRNWRESRHNAREMFEGARVRALECGYRIEEFTLREPGMSQARLGRIIRSRGIEGLLIAPMETPGAHLESFAWGHFASVAFGFSLLAPSLHRAVHDHYGAMMLLVRALRARGYDRLGLAIPRALDMRVRYLWRAAFLASQNVPVAGEEALVLPSEQWDRASFVSWVTRARPDGLVTIGPHAARWLRELGLRVPQDIGVANVDLASAGPGMSGIDQNGRLVGAAAVDVVVSLIRNNERGLPASPRVLLVEGAFVAGKTLRPLRRVQPTGEAVTII
jgi:LacI family transcriptional regulator